MIDSKLLHLSTATINTWKDMLQTFLLAALYGAVFYGIEFYFFKGTLVANLPSAASLSTWDAGWYQAVVQKGYHYDPHQSCTVGFYILFPLIWKFSMLGIPGICVLNILFFAAGFSLLCNILRPGTQDKLLWLTIPTVFFAFIPYSEALFFLLASLALYAIKADRRWLIWVSLFLLSLTRVTVVFVAPAFLAMSLTSAPRRLWYKSLYQYLVIYLTPLVLGTALFVWYQYYTTHKWFAYFYAQQRFWGHEFNLPTLPFSTFAGPPTIWLCALALFVGIFCFFFAVIRCFQWLLKDKAQDPFLIASCVYLATIMLEGILYNPIWSSGTTNLPSLLRYTFMNPFFYIFLDRFSIKAVYTWKNYVLVFFLSNLVWLTFASYTHIQHFLYMLGNTILIFFFMLHSDKRLQWPILALVALCFYFQVYLFQIFIGGTYYPD